MARGGQKTHLEEPERKCIATGEVHPRRGLIRFVVGPENQVVPDIAGKLPGRGIWVSAERDALKTAVRKNLFSRAARTKVTVPTTLVDDVESILLRRVTERLAMARKAGTAVAGYEKVKDWLDKGQAAILIQASDGSGRGKAKLRRPGGRGSHFDILSAQEIGLSFGREHVIHAALAAGGLADRFRDDAVRLSGVRSGEDGGSATGKVKKTI